MEGDNLTGRRKEEPVVFFFTFFFLLFFSAAFTGPTSRGHVITGTVHVRYRSGSLIVLVYLAALFRVVIPGYSRRYRIHAWNDWMKSSPL